MPRVEPALRRDRARRIPLTAAGAPREAPAPLAKKRVQRRQTRSPPGSARAPPGGVRSVPVRLEARSRAPPGRKGTMRGMACGTQRSACVQPPPRALAQRASPAAGVRPVALTGRAGLRLARRPPLRYTGARAQGNGNGGSGNGSTGVAETPSEVMVEDASASGSPFTTAAAEASPALRGVLNDGVMARWLLELRSNGALVRQAVPISDVGKVRARRGRGIAGRGRLAVAVMPRIAAAPLTRLRPLGARFRQGGLGAAPRRRALLAPHRDDDPVRPVWRRARPASSQCAARPEGFWAPRALLTASSRAARAPWRRWWRPPSSASRRRRSLAHTPRCTRRACRTFLRCATSPPVLARVTR